MCPVCNKKRIVHPHDKCWGCHKNAGATAKPAALPQRAREKTPEPNIEPTLQSMPQHPQEAIEIPSVLESQITAPDTIQREPSVHDPASAGLVVRSPSEHLIDKPSTPAADVGNGSPSTSTSSLSTGEDITDPDTAKNEYAQHEDDDDDEELSEDDSSEETAAAPSNRRSHEDDAERDRKKRIRRKSQTNSDGTAQLPKGTYMALIGLALLAADDNRLQTKAIVEWIFANIRRYPEPISKNTWSSRISATLSTHTGSKGRQLWTKEDWLENDSEVFGQGSWYRLNPGAAKQFKPWHETLRNPGAPQERVESDSEEQTDNDDNTESETESETLSRIVKLRLEKQAEQAAERPNQEESSDDELARDPEPDRTPQKIRTPRQGQTSQKTPTTQKVRTPQKVQTPQKIQPPQKVQTPQKVPTPMQVRSLDEELVPQAQAGPSLQVDAEATKTTTHSTPDPMDIDVQNEQHQPSRAQIRNQNAATLLLTGQPAMPFRKSMYIAKTDIQPPMYTSKSLFEKWPQYDPANRFDRDAKLAEIKARPTRKQLINKGPMHTRLGNKTLEPDRPRKATQESPEKQKTGDEAFKTTPRGPRHKFPKMQAGTHNITDEGVRVCQTLEEFFDLPENPIPIIHNGELAFRDGTLGKNGKLPRATVIYKTGPL